MYSGVCRHLYVRKLAATLGGKKQLRDVSVCANCSMLRFGG